MILITGATGTVGVPLTGELLAGDAPFRALVRDPRRAARMLGPEVDFVEGDYERPETLHAALARIERLCLISPLTPRLADLEGRVIDAAVRVEVEHIVKLSTLGVLRGTEGLSSPEPRQYHLHRLSEGRLEISGRLLDDPAPPLRAVVPAGYGRLGFQSSGVSFPSEGCWKLTGRVGSTALTFVVSVVKT